MSELTPIPRSPEFVRCYGCGPANDLGLRLEFQLDASARRVVAKWTANGAFAGYKTMVHGGVIATLLDEGMGWALWGVEGKTGVTREIRVRYLRPVVVDREYLVLGWVERIEGESAVIRASIQDPRGRVSADGTGEYTLISPDKVRDA